MNDPLYDRACGFVGAAALPATTAPDPVTAAAIRRWCATMGEHDPIHLDREAARAAGHAGIVAPLAMLDVWTMPPYSPEKGHAGMAVLTLFDAAGYSGVVATNIEQRYDRYLVEGDVVTADVTVASVSARKTTAIGEGYFVTLAYRFVDASACSVGSMTFRVLKFRPAAAVTGAAAMNDRTADDSPPARPRPAITRDNAFFWEGIAGHKLLFQRDRDGVLHHPPRPVVPGTFEPEIVAASGRGTIHSYVIVHQPQLPGLHYPLPVVLVELEEGVRMVANLVGVAPDAIAIGDPVEVRFIDAGGGATLPAFAPAVGDPV